MSRTPTPDRATSQAAARARAGAVIAPLIELDEPITFAELYRLDADRHPALEQALDDLAERLFDHAPADVACPFAARADARRLLGEAA